MEKLLLKRLRSNYILQKILNYIQNKITLKLFIHSKLFQNKLNIKFIDYQKEYFKDFSFEKFLCFNIIYDNNQDFDKNLIKDKLREDLSQKKFDYNNIINNQKYLIYYFKKYYNKINEEELDSYKNNKIIIDIYSPFFDELSKNEIFNEIFTVSILPRYIINKYKLKKDYINYFNKIKNSSLKINFSENEDFNIIEELNINNKSLKSLIINMMNMNNNGFSFPFNNKNINLNNLEKLTIDSKFLKSIKFNNNSFEYINNLNSLESLELNDLIFKGTFFIKLYNLKKLFLSNCKKISFGEEKSFDIEILELSNTILVEPKELLKFPNLKKYFINNISFLSDFYISIFDLIKFPTYLNISSDKINSINTNSSIEYLKCDCSLNNKEISKKILEKIISINSLKYINIELSNIYDEDISKIQGKNNSIKKAEILWNSGGNCILYNLQNKFPELSNLNICIPDLEDIEEELNKNPIIEIKQNTKCKINQFMIESVRGMNIKF